jgi:diacylglycerol kinase (ATP)
VRALAIVNPVAGNGNAERVWRRARAEVDGVRGWDCVVTERVGHALELARSAASSGFERVVCVGGDGTICEVANGLAHTDTALGIIPVGTGNDCAHNLAIPKDAVAAARLAATGPTRAIDLGRIQTALATRYFVNIAGFGFDAEVAWRVNRVPKLIGGTVPYVVGVLQTLLTYRSPRMRICLDGAPLEQRVFLVAVANNPSYGGGMRIAPQARPDDGQFDVCVVSAVSPPEVMRLVPKLYSGGHVGHHAVQLGRCTEVTAESEARVRCQADGELVGELPARLTIEPAALRCVAGEGFP